MTSHTSLENFPNLGKKSAQMLWRAGIRSREDLEDLGAVVAYLAVKQSGQNPSLNLLWAIAAGLQDRRWTDLSTAEKLALRNDLDELVG